MKKHGIALAIAALTCGTAATAGDPLNTWHPAAYVKLDFGGPVRRFEPHFGASMSLRSPTQARLLDTEDSLGIRAAQLNSKRPAYLSVDLTPGKELTTQWLGVKVLQHDFVKGSTFSPLNFTGADITAMTITGGLLGAAGLGYMISELTSDEPATAAAPVCAEGEVLVDGECVLGG